MVRRDDDVYHIYKLIALDEDWINPIADGKLNRQKDSCCFSDSDEELESWQNQLHEVSVLRYNHMTNFFGAYPERYENCLIMMV